MNCFRRPIVLCALVAGFWLAPAKAHAALWIDPEPPMRWPELLHCELVVVGKYQSHKGGTLCLEVVRVLRGKGVKPGQKLEVALKHLYSIETGAVVWNFMTKANKADGPKLCYKAQFSNPGGLEPFQILKDVKAPAIYFLPTAKAPALVRTRQVQPAWQADAWQQALAGRPTPLAFQLMQNVKPSLQRDAREELYESRDPAVLDQLFAWLVHPPEQTGLYFDWQNSNARVLAVIGDHQGDVWDRASKLLEQGDPRLVPALAPILASADRERAGRLFEQILKDRESPLRQAIASTLHDLGNDKWLDLACQALADSELSSAAMKSLPGLVARGKFNRSIAHLQEKARPRLQAALKNPRLAATLKKEIQYLLKAMPAEPPAIDFAKSRQILLDPNEPCYQGQARGQGDDLLRGMRQTCDLRCVALLAEILANVPASQGDDCYPIREALRYYGGLCPNALERELARHAVKIEPDAKPNSVLHELRKLLQAERGEISNLGDLARMVREQQARGLFPSVSPTVFKMVDEAVLNPDSMVQSMEILLVLDRPRGRIVLRQLLEQDGWLQQEERALVNALGVSQDLRKLDSGWLNRAQGSVLLLVDDPRALARYLKVLDAQRKVRPSPYGFEEELDLSYLAGLEELFPRHPGPYFQRILALLESSNLVERMAAVQVLERQVFWNFGFDPLAFKKPRSAKLARVRPHFQELAGKQEWQIRAHIIRQFGYQLKGDISTWLLELRRAALDPEPSVSRNALWLVEQITHKPGCSYLAFSRPYLRKLQIEMYLKDREDPGPRLSRKELDALWTELGQSDSCRGYQATCKLVARPEQAVALFKQHCKPAIAADAANVARLVRNLDNVQFDVRDKAAKELARLGEQAEPTLRQVLKKPCSLEVRRRLERLLDQVEQGPTTLSLRRAMAVLEQIGTPEARQLVAALARGAPDTHTTREALATLKRLGQNKP